MLSFSIGWQCWGKMWSVADIWKRDTYSQKLHVVWELDRCKLSHSLASIAKDWEFHLQRMKDWRQDKNQFLTDWSQESFHSYFHMNNSLKMMENTLRVELGRVNRAGSGVNITKSRVRVKHALRPFLQSRVIFTVFPNSSMCSQLELPIPGTWVSAPQTISPMCFI